MLQYLLFFTFVMFSHLTSNFSSEKDPGIDKIAWHILNSLNYQNFSKMLSSDRRQNQTKYTLSSSLVKAQSKLTPKVVAVYQNFSKLYHSENIFWCNVSIILIKVLIIIESIHFHEYFTFQTNLQWKFLSWFCG